MTDAQDKSNSLIEALLGIAVIAVIAGIVSGVFFYRNNIAQAFREFTQDDVAISTTPSGAKLIFDGQYVGLSPQVVKANRGAHTVTASLNGYITASQAVSFNYNTSREKFYSEPWIVNIKLERDTAPTAQSNQPKPVQQPLLTDSTATALQKQIDDLRGIILVRPQDAISIAAMKDRVILLTDQNQQMKEEIREIRSYSGWVIGIAVTTIISFIGFIITLLLSRSKSP